MGLTMTEDMPGRSIDIEHVGDLSPRAYLSAIARIDLPARTRAFGLHLSDRSRPSILSGEDLAYNGGRPDRDDLPDVRVWIVGDDEFQAFADKAAADDEWGWFPGAALARQRSSDRSNLCLAMGIEPDVMSGFLILRRGIAIEDRREATYHFDFDRAYVLPEARGTGLSTAFVAAASLVFRHEFDALAKALTPSRGKARVTPYLSGEAESPGGARMLNALIEEIADVCESIDADHDRVTVEDLVADVETYDPDGDTTPRP